MLVVLVVLLAPLVDDCTMTMSGGPSRPRAAGTGGGGDGAAQLSQLPASCRRDSWQGISC